MANTIKLVDELQGVGIFDKTTMLPQPFRMSQDQSTPLVMTVAQVQISDRIPNIFDGRPFGLSFNNTGLRVGTDTQPYVDVILETGLYLDYQALNAAINSAINVLGWWTNPADPGLVITANDVIDRFCIEIDSTKLNPLFGTQFRLDLREATTNSKLYYTLGFLPTDELTADGLYSSTNYPVMETQGTSCIICSSFMPGRPVGSTFVPYLADVSFAGKYTTSDITWPTGNISNTALRYTGERTLTQVRLYVVTRDGAPMIFMGGRLSVEISITAL